MSTTVPQTSQRAELLARLDAAENFDLAVVGGGATGLGIALDAAARGLRVVLLESHDFAKGTSSRATKLVHGGVRYLAQGNVALVREALHERRTLLANALHLAQPLPFVVPSYGLRHMAFYGLGLKVYDALAGRDGLGSTDLLSKRRTLQLLPNAKQDGLRGGVRYWDGQFDDARLALALARTAASRGALVLNYCEVTALLHEGGKVRGLRCRDTETGSEHTVHAACVVNAAGVWVDAIRGLDGGAAGAPVKPLVAPSQGVHLVVDREFLPTDHALLVPRTADGRVLFAVPWLGKTVLGTTDTPRQDLSREPTALPAEVDFILGEAAKVLTRAPRRSDVRSIWVGLRPLVRPDAGEGEGGTKSISREHTVRVSRSGLVTVTGGKWTTYRSMAEDVLQQCRDAGLLKTGPGGVTRKLMLVGAEGTRGHTPLSAAPGLHSYGNEAAYVATLDQGEPPLGEGLTPGMVRFAARHEYARSVEDVLARRHRALFLDAKAAAALAPAVADILREEAGIDPRLDDFLALARNYASVPAPAGAEA